MSSNKRRVVHSYCLSHAKSWALFLVNQKAEKGDVFRITRENLDECFQSSEDEEDRLPEVDENTKRINLTFVKVIELSDESNDDFLVFTFDESADPQDTFILKPSALTIATSTAPEQKPDDASDNPETK